MKSRPKLNDKTPKWFKEWHDVFYLPLERQVQTNKRLVYVILVAIIIAAISGNFDVNGIAKCIASIMGGG
jgi:hypothetical protein